MTAPQLGAVKSSEALDRPLHLRPQPPPESGLKLAALPSLLSFFSSTSTQSPNFMFRDYLITSFGLHRFTDSAIKTLRILCSSPEATLDPNLRNLRSMGLSSSVLNKILLSSPCALLCSSAVPKITFWMDFPGGDKAALVKAFKRNRGLINHDISQSTTPKFSLLQRHGYSTNDIGRIVATVSRFITTRISLMEDLLSRASELGFQPGSGMFLVALSTMTSVTREALQRKMELLISFGWSEDEFFAALRKAPGWVQLSEKNLQEKMVFLVREAGCDPSYIASHPLLHPFSLEKRVRPCVHVLHLLE